MPWPRSHGQIVGEQGPRVSFRFRCFSHMCGFRRQPPFSSFFFFFLHVLFPLTLQHISFHQTDLAQITNHFPVAKSVLTHKGSSYLASLGHPILWTVPTCRCLLDPWGRVSLALFLFCPSLRSWGSSGLCPRLFFSPASPCPWITSAPLFVSISQQLHVFISDQPALLSSRSTPSVS